MLLFFCFSGPYFSYYGVISPIRRVGNGPRRAIRLLQLSACRRGRKTCAIKFGKKDAPARATTPPTCGPRARALPRTSPVLSTVHTFRPSMEFDSLAFSASRLPQKREHRVYCPACQEVCEPELPTAGADEPTCPVCAGGCVAPPAGSRMAPVVPALPEEVRPSATVTTATSTPESVNAASDAAPDPAAAAAATAAVATMPAAPSPPPPAAAATAEAVTPPAVRRAAVSERVAREVLNFMAAIERGELTAVGLPEVPGAAIFEDGGLGGGLGGGGGARSGRSAPALEQVVKNLPRTQVEENSWVLHQTVLRLTGGPPESEVSIEAVFAPFSPPPAETVLGPVVLAIPPTADRCLDNEANVKGSVLIMDRGKCTFASKALRADAAGAAAAVIVQTHDVWPYVMEDSRGEAKEGGGLTIPVCMVSKEKGELIKKVVLSAAEGETIRAELSVSSSEKDCIVCQELYAVGATLVRLPCGHFYHEACLLKWLKLSNTCPYCRSELPSSNEAAERARRSRQAAGGDDGEEPWRAFFD